jgi:catechol 2,3-dioxygenase-like lactoylglutathione lyase family enzyme
MSYVALGTDFFNEVTRFYGTLLGFPVVAEWDRPHGRGRRYDLGGLRLEILDNTRERRCLELYKPGERTHLVIEVDDIELARHKLATATPEPQTVSWGARLFQLRDPDGIPVTFLQWSAPP